MDGAWASERDAEVVRERDRLAAAFTRALEGLQFASGSLAKLTGLYDVEFAEGPLGADLQAQVDSAARSIRLAGAALTLVRKETEKG